MSFSQAHRNLQVSTPLGEDVLLAVGLRAHEEISGLFRYELDLLAHSDDVDVDALVEEPAVVRLRTATGTRYFSGVVRSIQQTETDLGLASFRAELVPWLWLLTLTRDCRIFQHKAVPEILTQIFDELGCADYELRLEASYAKRTYCVQYRESDFAFASRLMEEEGIHYFFRHEPSRHVLVLGDGPAASPSLEGGGRFRFNRDRRSVQPDDVVLSLLRERRVRSSRVHLDDYNFETPRADISAQRADEAGSGRWEIYDYPGRYPDASLGGRRARVWLEAEGAAAEELVGTSFCRAILPGHRFELVEHPLAARNRAYLLTRVDTRVTELGGYQPGRGSRTDFSYENSFAAMPWGVRFRPLQRTPRPLVHGSQTAVVVGPSGEEIYTDKHGRVKVQFHWDREGQADENSSCWMRVSQSWAGKSWGATFLPRIGQEVIVDFLEGDPDRPLVTGRVYNAEAMPPLDLPAEKTKSTIKSRSTKGGTPANFNELRFEDKKGSEEVYIHAERDHNQVTEHDRSEEVGNDRSLEVGHDKSEEVGNDKRVLVKHDLAEEVQNDETLKVARDRKREVGRDESVRVGQNETIEVGRDLARKVGSDETLEVGQSRRRTVGSDEEVEVGGSRKLTVGSDQEIEVGGAHELKAREIVLEADTSLELRCGAAKIRLEVSGLVTIEGVNLTLRGAGAVVVQGATIALN